MSQIEPTESFLTSFSICDLGLGPKSNQLSLLLLQYFYFYTYYSIYKYFCILLFKKKSTWEWECDDVVKL